MAARTKIPAEMYARLRAAILSGGGHGFVPPESKAPSCTREVRFSIALALLLCFVLIVPASARDWHLARFDTQMSVAPDGVVDVTERLDLVFVGSYHGIHRDIPIEYPGPHGSNYTLFLQVTGVTDGAFPLKYDSTTQNGYRHLTIYIPGAVNTTRTVEIHYTVTNAVRWFDDHDELYWNVTGNGWAVPIDSASTHIVFPVNASGELRAQAFTGQYGSHERDATVQVGGNAVSVATNDPLSMREGLTADVYITKGVLTQPSLLTQTIWFVRSNSIVLLPLWAFLVMFFFWWTKGRDPKPDISVAPRYEPPKGMTPAEVGTLIDDAVHPRDITATLVDLGVKGYLKIEEVVNTFPFSRRDYIFHLLKPQQSEWASLEPHERVMLHGMFSAGGGMADLKQLLGSLAQRTPQFGALTNLQQVRTALDGLVPDDATGNATDVHLSDLKNHFYAALPAMKENILAVLKGKGMYSVDPRSAHVYVLLGVLFTFVGFIVVQVLMHVLGVVSLLGSPGLFLLSAIIAVVIIILFARIMTAKSQKGVDTKVEILGLQEFITRVDADRLKRMPPDTFEKILPYAMALGIENRWAKAFQGILQNPPNWYVGQMPDMAFNPILFAGSMHSMAMDANQAFVAAPRASSTGSGWSSSDSGGGSSGGGFGGGGGDAF
ncbi:MAG: DUF2207 domain-containing protein [Acidobacteriota bacterium]|nr:DUF2207 domain-containing protein [Acidobacteriota bacterium]